MMRESKMTRERVIRDSWQIQVIPVKFLHALARVRLFRFKRFWAVLLLPLSLLLVSLAGAYPRATEYVYSRGIYPVLSGFFGRISSAVPRSLAEGLILLASAALAVYLAVQVVGVVRRRSSRRMRVARLAATVLCIAGTGYFVFTVFCGFNYHRLSLAETSGLTVRPSSTMELVELCEELAAQANSLRAQLPEDDRGVMMSAFSSVEETAVYAQTSYRVMGESYPALSGYTVLPKPVTLSRAMSYLNITGVYIPFLFEANVNVDIPDFWIPCTMMHEQSHFKGYMREEEANFISYLACRQTDNAEFAYSGTMMALIHSINALYAADKELYWEITEQLTDGVFRDLADNSAYWRQFEGPVAEASSAVNDAYLKSNKQENGVKSYGQMVDLLLAEYRDRHGLV